MVEFTLFVPLLLLILLVAVDFGRVFMSYVNIQNMARIGANYAAINATAWQTGDTVRQDRYRTLMGFDDATASGCDLPSPLPQPVFSGYTFGSNVRVDISCDFQLITPFLSSLIGDGAGNVPISATTNFTVRTGSVDSGSIGAGGLPSAPPTATAPPTPTPTPTATPTPTPTPGPSGSLDPGATPTPTSAPPTASPTIPPVTVDFYGTPTSVDSEGGGPSPSPGFENIVGIPTLPVTFTNATTGVQQTCLWSFGDGTTGAGCGSTVSKSYSVKGTYNVTLTVNGQQLVRPGYVLVGCKVPSLIGRKVNTAAGEWVGDGFTAGNLSKLAGNGNYSINYQSLVGGLLNPPGGCDGATIQVGP